MLLENEVLEDLQYNNLYIIQKKDGFRFGMDPILLSDFSQIRNHDSIVDLGTGTGIISILLSQKVKHCSIKAFEIQEHMANMAQRSVLYNQLENKILIIEDNYCNYIKYISKNSIDVVVCNPPYGRQKSTIQCEDSSKNIAKHEIKTSLQNTIQTASELLRFGGRFYICFPSTRLIELVEALKMYKLEPKKMRFVHTKINKSPYLVLMESVKNGKPFLQILPPLQIYKEDNIYTEEVNKIYHI